MYLAMAMEALRMREDSIYNAQSPLTVVPNVESDDVILGTDKTR